MKILITTDIYPPEIGGPAEYAAQLQRVWESQGYQVSVSVFSRYKKYPWGVRHILFLLSAVPAVFKADFILALGVFSGGAATVLAKAFNKKIVLRTGGDFLWEMYVERTGELVLLREFYLEKMSRFSPKEKLIFRLTRWLLRNVSAVVWSTEWQKQIFLEPYQLSHQNNFIIENYYGPKLQSEEPTEKNFVAMTRKLKWKHVEFLERIFNDKEVKLAGAALDTETAPHDEFLEKLSCSYAVIIASLGDVSPNTILDAIRFNKPFILTRENGLAPRIGEIGLFIDPKSPADVKEKVLWLLDPAHYALQKAKIEAFNFTHTWEDMADEYIEVYKKII